MNAYVDYPKHSLKASAANRFPFVSAFTANEVLEMVLVENAFLYSGAGDGFYYRVNTKKVGVTHFMRDNGAAWRASVEGKKMPIAQLEPVGNLA